MTCKGKLTGQPWLVFLRNPCKSILKVYPVPFQGKLFKPSPTGIVIRVCRIDFQCPATRFLNSLCHGRVMRRPRTARKTVLHKNKRFSTTRNGCVINVHRNILTISYPKSPAKRHMRYPKLYKVGSLSKAFCYVNFCILKIFLDKTFIVSTIVNQLLVEDIPVTYTFGYILSSSKRVKTNRSPAKMRGKSSHRPHDKGCICVREILECH